jgi:tRNA(Ile)-lysidine synthase
MDLASRLELPCLVDHPPAPAGNIEEGARIARLRFFNEAPCDRVATAHTASDQAETVLFRILRGSGLAGLTGIYPVWGRIARPLLGVSREEVNAWVAERRLDYREDATNQETRFARNRIRHQLLPQLAAEWNPRIEPALCHLAEVASAEDMYLESLLPPLPEPGPGGTRVLEAALFDDLPPALVRRFLRRLVAAVKPPGTQIDFAHIESIRHLRPGHDRVILPGVDVLRSFGWIRFSQPAEAAERNWSIPAAVPGEVEAAQAFIAIGLQELVCGYNEAGCWVYADPRQPLRLRNWRPGDRLEKAPGEAPSLKQLFQDFRIPLWERRDWPVLEQAGRLVWTAEFGAAAGSGPRLFLKSRLPSLPYRRRENRSP